MGSIIDIKTKKAMNMPMNESRSIEGFDNLKVLFYFGIIVIILGIRFGIIN